MRCEQRRPCVWFLSCVVACGVALTLASNAPANQQIVNGLYTSDFPSTGMLLYGSDPTVADIQCSGTMIGCDTFLTAAHCVCDFTGLECEIGGIEAPDPADYHVFLQHSGRSAIASISVHPGYDYPDADLAVIKLASPVEGISPTPINTQMTPVSGTSQQLGNLHRPVTTGEILGVWA